MPSSQQRVISFFLVGISVATVVAPETSHRKPEHGEERHDGAGAQSFRAERSLLYEPPYSYLQCYKDSASLRALPHYRGWAGTTAECSRLCASINATHMGRQYWGECWCGGPTGYDIHGLHSSCENCASDGYNLFFGLGVNCVFQLTAGFASLPAPISSYVGCFEDRGGSQRDLPHYMGQGMSLSACATQCSSQGYTYMGRQYHQECWCGDTYGQHGSSAHCNDCTSSQGGYNVGGSVNCIFSLSGVSNSAAPTNVPTVLPTMIPISTEPTNLPTDVPSVAPTENPTAVPTDAPITSSPSATPSKAPVTEDPTMSFPVTSDPTDSPSSSPTGAQVASTDTPTDDPTSSPTMCGGPDATPFQCPIVVFRGCYRDDVTRDLPVYVGGGMRTQTCAEKCAGRGYAFMGRQYEAECWCGQSYGLHGNSTDCNQCIVSPGIPHNYGISVNCVFEVKVDKAPCVVTPVKALLIKPDTFVWWHGRWGGNVDGYMRWLQDRIVALKNIGLVEGVSVAMKMNDEINGVPYSDFFYNSNLTHTRLYTREGYQESLLLDFLRAMRRNGLKTYAWIPALFDPFLVSSGGSSYAAVHRDSNGPHGGLSASDRFASVFNSATRNHVYAIIEEVLTKDGLNDVATWDGIRLDYIRFEGHRHDFSDLARSQFQVGGSPDPWTLVQDLSNPDWVDWMNFRRAAITDFLRNATNHARFLGGLNLDVGGYLLPFAAPGCMQNHFDLGYETFGWEQGNCYEDYDAFDFRLLPMTYWQDWTTEPNFSSWTSAVVESTAGYNNPKTTPTGSITDCNFQSPGCSSRRSASQVVSSFRAFAEMISQQGTDGMDVFLFDEFEDSHFDNLEEALIFCSTRMLKMGGD